MKNAFRNLANWFEDRTGARSLAHEALAENIPFGARLRYASGSMLVFAFVTQMLTGLFLWMAYSPSSQTAWESVYYIQYQMVGGWLLRGIHHFMAQAMMVLLGIHLLQVTIDKAYKAPREVNYWLGLILMQIVMALGLTGYLLPWDQKGFWATRVATSLMTLLPFGDKLQMVVLGGGEYGHHTLTRFFALHAGVLPLTMMVFLALHILVFRRHGIKAVERPNKPDQKFWPHQVFWDGLACLILMVIVLLCTVHFDIGGVLSGDLAVENRGAELMAPADPSESFDAARPEWYFLFLFQLLKYFDGSQGFINSEVVGAVVLPGILITLLAAAPLIGRFKGGHAFNVGFLIFLLVGAGVLTAIAKYEDANNAEFQMAQHKAHEQAQRAIALAERRVAGDDGELGAPQLIPKEGAISLVRNDPKVQGPVLFERHCASCHAYAPSPETLEMQEGEESAEALGYMLRYVHPKTTGEGDDAKVVKQNGKIVYEEMPMGAPNLYRYASREWLTGLLDPEKIALAELIDPVRPAEGELSDALKDRKQIHAPYFGSTAHKDGRMEDWVRDYYGLYPKLIASAEEKVKELEDEQKSLGDESENKERAAEITSEIADLTTRIADLTKKKEQRESERADIVVAISAQAQLAYQGEQDEADAERIDRGLSLAKQTCATYCHRVGESGQLGLAPDLTGYGSYEWMMGLVSDPSHERYYRRENDRMPSFAASLQHPVSNTASFTEISIIVDWLRDEYYDPERELHRLPHNAEEAIVAVNTARAVTVEPPKLVGLVADDERDQNVRARKLFTANCSGCHSWVDDRGHGIVAKQPTAPNLRDYGSRAWLRGLLSPDEIVGPKFFGNTKHVDGDMASFVESDLASLDDEDQADLDAVIVALSAEAELPSQQEIDAKAKEDGLIEKGKEAIDSMTCTECHQYGEDGEENYGPQLDGWASRDWIKRIISNPETGGYHDNNDRMPAFHPGAEGDNNRAILTDEEVDLLARWLRGEKLTD